MRTAFNYLQSNANQTTKTNPRAMQTTCWIHQIVGAPLWMLTTCLPTACVTTWGSTTGPFSTSVTSVSTSVFKNIDHPDRTLMNEWYLHQNSKCSAALMCCQKAGVRLRDTKWIPQETSLWPVLCGRINCSTSESPIKMPPCYERWPQDVPQPLTQCTLERLRFRSHFIRL